jgi:hypothetical protein
LTAPEVAEKRRYLQVFKQDPLGCRWTATVVGGQRDCLAGSWQSADATWNALLGSIIHAGLQTAGGDDLLSRPDSEGEGARTTGKHDVGAIVGPLEQQDGAATAHPDEGGVGEVSRQLVRQQVAFFFLGREIAGDL